MALTPLPQVTAKSATLLPGECLCCALLTLVLRHLPRLQQVPRHSLEDADIEALANAAHGYVGADLVALVNEAALVALRYAGDRSVYKYYSIFENLWG